jgi:two-component system, OmpR family, sensor histidine kinase QseC
MHIRGHRPLLEMALRNLIDNGLRHTPAGTEVEVQVLPELSVIRVCDGHASGRCATRSPAQTLRRSIPA